MKFSRADLTAKTGIFDEVKLAKHAAGIIAGQVSFEVKDSRFTLKGDELKVVVYSAIHPPRVM